MRESSSLKIKGLGCFHVFVIVFFMRHMHPSQI